jgi:hypothetical protein
MKKLLPSVTLAFASLAGLAASANAGTFGLFVGCRCCKDCGGTITLRQYNAFSPAACGSMMFQGCVVAPPNPGYGFDGGYGGGCADGSCGQGTTVGRMQFPAQNAYPIQGGSPMQGAYAYNPQMQMPQMQYPQMQYPQMQYPQQQYTQMPMPQMQFPQMQYPQAQYTQMPQMPAAPLPASVTQPAAARVP